MRTENERWRERDGENRASPTESDGTDVERESETDKEEKPGIKTDRQGKDKRGRERQKRKYTRHWASLPSGLSLFLYLVVINGQIRAVLGKCKSAGGEIKQF